DPGIDRRLLQAEVAARLRLPAQLARRGRLLALGAHGASAAAASPLRATGSGLAVRRFLDFLGAGSGRPIAQAGGSVPGGRSPRRIASVGAVSTRYCDFGPGPRIVG